MRSMYRRSSELLNSLSRSGRQRLEFGYWRAPEMAPTLTDFRSSTNSGLSSATAQRVYAFTAQVEVVGLP